MSNNSLLNSNNTSQYDTNINSNNNNNSYPNETDQINNKIKKKSINNQNNSVTTTMDQDPNAALDGILEKIRRNKHEAQGWTQEKLNELVKPRN